MAVCVVIVPVLRRPHRVVPTLESVQATTPASRVLFVCTEGDREEQAAIKRAGGEYVVLPGEHGPGDYAKKINYAYHHTDEPLLFLGADDLAFHEGWFKHATDPLGGLIHVVGTNDLGSKRVMRGTHSTHSLVTRTYVDEYGTIDEHGKVLHEGYWHEYVDDEFVQTAQARGAFVSARHAFVEHLHPSWGKGEMDPLYAQQARRMRYGRRLFDRRRELWTSPLLSQPSATNSG